MELTVRPARAGDYEEIDRLTLKGFKTAHITGDRVEAELVPISRSSSYVCTIKGSAYMRSTDALTFVCVKHIVKQGFMESIFGRVPRRGSDASAEQGNVQGRASVCYKDLDAVEHIQAKPAVNSRRASVGMRGTRDTSNSRPATRMLADAESRFNSPSVSSDSKSTSATGSLTRDEIDSNGINKNRDRKIARDKSFVLLAAGASSDSMDRYKSIGTLRGHEIEFGLGAGIRNRVKRHEGPEERLLQRNELEGQESPPYDPSRGTSAYRKPAYIDLEASVSPEGYLMARPSPMADASDFLESSPKARNRRGSDPNEVKPLETPFHLFRRRRGSNSSSKGGNPSGCIYENCIEEKIVGCVTYAPYESGWGIVSDLNDVELRMLSVHPIRGVAGLLIDHCVRIARDELRSAVHVLVNGGNRPAHLLYVRHGFLRNAANDRFDPNSNLSLKCFTMGLGNPAPARKLTRTNGSEDTTAPEGTASSKSPKPELKSSFKERFRVGMLFNLHSMRRERLTLYQELKSGICQGNTADAQS